MLVTLRHSRPAQAALARVSIRAWCGRTPRSGSPTCPTPRTSSPNPIGGLISWRAFDAPDFPHGVQTRQGDFLPLEDRVAHTRERHAIPMGTAGGPAEKRSIVVGRKKLGQDG